MVKFLLHNTLGACGQGRCWRRTPDLARDAPDEDALGMACALPGIDREYQRFVRDLVERGPWRPAAGMFPDWPERASEITSRPPAAETGIQQAPLLGSLIELTGGDLVDPTRIARLDQSIAALVEKMHGAEPERAEGARAARGMADATAILAQRFTLQATNVPFLGRRKQANGKFLAGLLLRSQIHRKKPKGKPMPRRTARANARKSAVRAAVEHVCARQKGPMGLFIRTIGLARARTKIGLANLLYNMQRMVWLTGRIVPT